jgi:ankyrin repeat protein
VDNGADVNALGSDYSNALYAAAQGGHEPIVRLLIGKGADINAQGGYYGNALYAAAECGHEPIVRLLVDNGANMVTTATLSGLQNRIAICQLPVFYSTVGPV